MCIRVRVFAVELIVAASAQPFIPEAVAEARAALAAEAGALLDVHTGLIYGDARKDLTGENPASVRILRAHRYPRTWS